MSVFVLFRLFFGIGSMTLAMRERELPSFAARGTQIEASQAQQEVRKTAESARDWEYAPDAVYLYRMAQILKDRLIDPLHRLDRGRLPDPVIAFENLRNNRTLAAFRLTRNPNGLENEIIFNTAHYERVEENEKAKVEWKFGRWAQLETLLHEYVHEWQQVFGKDPVQLDRITHNKEFVQKCESLGLHPKLGEGYHTRLADGPFALLMKELGIDPPTEIEQEVEYTVDWFRWGKEREGRSTLSKWSCGCQNVRVGTKEFHAQCLRCGNVFTKQETGKSSKSEPQLKEDPERYSQSEDVPYEPDYGDVHD